MLRLGVRVLLTLFPMVRAMDPVVPVPDVVDDDPVGLEHPETTTANTAAMARNHRLMDFRFDMDGFSSKA
jgi:hypothetical protein